MILMHKIAQKFQLPKYAKILTMCQNFKDLLKWLTVWKIGILQA